MALRRPENLFVVLWLGRRSRTSGRADGSRSRALASAGDERTGPPIRRRGALGDAGDSARLPRFVPEPATGSTSDGAVSGALGLASRRKCCTGRYSSTTMRRSCQRTESASRRARSPRGCVLEALRSKNGLAHVPCNDHQDERLACRCRIRHVVVPKGA